ncbi:MAG: hypothetical protein FWB91_06640 [Defluviitaleaceae bacterium]|nr:hypothetical protein [Defluviitaleaceae bacterium]
MLIVKLSTGFEFQVNSVSRNRHAHTPGLNLHISSTMSLDKPSALTQFTPEAVTKITVLANAVSVDVFEDFTLMSVDEQITADGRIFTAMLTKGVAENATNVQ